MSEVHPAVMGTSAVDPAATEPVTTTALEASTDPVRPTETGALSPESRSELANGTDASATAAGTEAPKTEANGDKVSTAAGAVDAQPMTEGVLGYKAPGLVKSLIFSKKFFWFSDEPVEHKHLSGYVANEKSDVAHPNAAHATQTGKGLLFFAKRAEDKPHPAGIINLAGISDVSRVDFNDFSFKLHGHKHTFQAQSRAERDSWIAAIETRATEAKASREGIVSSAGYKSALDKFGGAGVLAAAPGAPRSMSRPKKSTEGRLQEESVAGGVVAANGSSAEDTKPAPTTATEKKSRSQSRKRNSIFGTLLGKKEEHDMKKDEKKEEKAEEKAAREEVKMEEKAEKEEKKELKYGGGSTSAPLDAAAIASRVVAEPVVPAEGVNTASAGEIASTGATEPTAGTTTSEALPTTVTPAREAAPRPAKRNSIFGSFFGKKDVASPSKEDAAPVVPVKDAEPTGVSATAPQLENPVNTASQPTETAPASTMGKLDTTAASTPATKQNVSPSATKGGIFGFMKQKEVQHEEKKDIKAEEKAESGSSNAPVATTEPGAPVAAASTATPEASAPVTSPVASPAATATTPENGKNTRRQSFFSTLGTKKEKKPGAISDGEATDGEGKKSASSKLGGLFRKPSRAQGGKSTSDAAEPMPTVPKETTEAQVPTATDAPITTEATHTNGETAAEPHMPAAEKSFGDVGTEAASSSHHQQTPAVQASA